MELSEICHSFQINAALSFPEHGSVTTETSLYTSLCRVRTGSRCTIVHSYVVFLSDYWYFCPHVRPHVTNTRSWQLNPGIGDYSDVLPVIKFRNFVFVGILTSPQLDCSTANKWIQIAQKNSAHLELLMGAYVLTFDPYNIWICCNFCIQAIRQACRMGCTVQHSESAHCTLYSTVLQGRCCSQARTRADFWTDDWWLMGVRIYNSNNIFYARIINWIYWTKLFLVACDSMSYWLI